MCGGPPRCDMIRSGAEKDSPSGSDLPPPSPLESKTGVTAFYQCDATSGSTLGGLASVERPRGTPHGNTQR